MNINSSLFVILFIPFVVLTFQLLPNHFKKYLTLSFNLIFLGFAGLGSLAVTILMIVINYIAIILMKKRTNKKFVLILSIIFNIVSLVLFKYSSSFNSILFNDASYFTWLQPVGVSFFIFKNIAYLVDNYKDVVVGKISFVNYFTYASFFPVAVSGPILRYNSFENSLDDITQLNSKEFMFNMTRLYYGLFQKVFLANQFAVIADEVFELPFNQISTPIMWLGALSYTLQIYFDFSGYSDIAIGLAGVLGYNIPENFNYPYVSRSLSDFWTRWHISLTQWFRDYIYIPLGGNRVAKYRHYINMLVVWLLTGIWHGNSMNFIYWGLFNLIILIIEKNFFTKYTRFFEKRNVFNMLYSFIVINIGWVFFRSNSAEAAFKYIKIMFSFNIDKISLAHVLSYFLNHPLIWIIGFVLVTPIVPKLYSKLFYTEKNINKLIVAGIFLIIFIVTIIFVVSSSYSSFIYEQF